MLNFILRRLTKFILPIKIILLASSIGALGYFVIKTPPDLGNIVFFSLILFIFLSLALSFFQSVNRSLVIALSASFLLFLKAVGLLSPLNIGLFVVFMGLLGLYLSKK